ncbi:uncharacterized protein [Antedon mediterranea]|uniref:uncharacterized protein n=1 Tax=Antedon mediterranea TaxID=105859 RepID=UPI003AF8FFB1
MGKDCDQTTTVAPTPAESSPAITVLSIIFISMGCLYCLYVLFKLIVWLSKFKKRKQNREKIEGYTEECDGCQKMKYFCACDKKKDDQHIDDKTSPSETTAIGFDNNLSYIKEEDEMEEEKAEEAIVGLEEDSNYNVDNTQSREEIK